ncbi:MAG: F0F1 ATP synthase subunit epsilon [Propionibacteriaceae bacterium]|jgi:F-type H+-transporting ATPase subunit epsilon|nr:F0F1 ATP synthase subunit epsilon [Propionibacteriaceae bacterium]
MAETFWVEVVSADKLVWEGEATQLTAMTTTGEVGILAHHIPLIATLAAGTAEIAASDGVRHIIAVDGGFVSVTTEMAAIISPYAALAHDIDVTEARRTLLNLEAKREAGDNSLATRSAYHRAMAQVKAAERHK